LTLNWQLLWAKLLIGGDCGFGDGGEVIVEKAPISVEREALETKVTTAVSSSVGAAILSSIT